MRRPLLMTLAAAAVGCCWLRRGLLKSMAMRGLIAVLPDPAKRHGIDMRFPIDRGAWTRYTLHADLSLALSGVLDHVVEAAAYSHYGGFALNNVYWLNEKGALQLADSFPIKPKNMRASAEQAFANLTTNPTELYAAIERLDALIAETRAIIASG